MALFLDCVGGLMMGPAKLFGDTEVTREEFDALQGVPAAQRAEELAKLRAKEADAPAA